MDFSHNEQQRMAAETLSRFLAQNYPLDVRHAITRSAEGWSKQTWSDLADLGMVGALFPEDAGGFGGGAFDIAALFEQLGRALVVEPFLGTVMAGRVLTRVAGGQPLLGPVVAGDVVVAFAHEEARNRYDLMALETRATKGADGWTLEGTKVVVPQLGAAQHVVVSARLAADEGRDGAGAPLGLFLVNLPAAGVTVRTYPLIDGGHGGDLVLAGAPATLLAAAAGPLIEEAIAAGIVALSWEAVGIMDVVRDQTLEYLRTRKQFGVAIGSFQALQHRMATLAIAIEQARSSAINAAAALEAERSHREAMVSAAKYTIGAAGKLICEEAIQLHGGIGMTWELPLSHYAKRLTMIDHQLGDEDHHLERFIAFRAAA